MRSTVRLALLFASLGFGSALVSGCGSGVPAPVPTAVVGTYAVNIASGGQTDVDVMTASVGSDDNVLLDFVAGISEVRCKIEGTSMLTLPQQTLHVDHSTGVADGQATGGGTISGAGAVDITIHLSTTGFETDAGTTAVVDYVITGTKMM